MEPAARRLIKERQKKMMRMRRGAITAVLMRVPMSVRRMKPERG